MSVMEAIDDLREKFRLCTKGKNLTKIYQDIGTNSNTLYRFRAGATIATEHLRNIERWCNHQTCKRGDA